MSDAASPKCYLETVTSVCVYVGMYVYILGGGIRSGRAQVLLLALR